MSSNDKANDNNKPQQPKNPLESAMNQIRESALKQKNQIVKDAVDEYVKAREVMGKCRQKVLDAIDALKNELKSAR